MTAQLIRYTAKQIAGKFFESHERSMRFRITFPDQGAYVAGHWPHHVQEAKKHLVGVMLAHDTPQNQKDLINDDLIEDFERSQSSRARDVLQVTSDAREREDIRHVDNSPELRSVRA